MVQVRSLSHDTWAFKLNPLTTIQVWLAASIIFYAGFWNAPYKRIHAPYKRSTCKMHPQQPPHFQAF